MSYPKQQSVAKRLHAEMHSALDTMQARHRHTLRMLWARSGRELRQGIFQAYRRTAPVGKWNLPALKRSGAFSYLSMVTEGSLRRFHALAQHEMKSALKEMRRAAQLRYAYILDQTTPESRRVLVPIHAMAREADAPVNPVGWSDRLTTWVDGYGNNLLQNVQMGAMNQSPISDAVDEVDATTVNTPKSTLENAVDRLYEWNAVASIADGESDVAALNDDLIDVEIWKTRGDMAVCDECGENEGLTPEESDGDIPYHPNCHCYWAVVPIEYAELLRSGDENDQALARIMQAKNLVPFSMTVADDEGGVAARAIVSFEAWIKGDQRVAGGR